MAYISCYKYGPMHQYLTKNKIMPCYISQSDIIMNVNTIKYNDAYFNIRYIIAISIPVPRLKSLITYYIV